jgi:hypothetical protein
MGTNATTVAGQTDAVAKAPRSFSTTLHGADGATLRIMALKRADGSAITFAVHTVKDGKKRKNTRGATEQHPSLDKAKVAMEKLAATALKAGWVKKERAGGFARKPDAFTSSSLPAAKASKK